MRDRGRIQAMPSLPALSVGLGVGKGTASFMPADFSFKDMTLRQVEEVVGAAIDHRHAMLDLYGTRQLVTFRSEQSYELNRITNVLFAWYERGLYNTERNRDRLDKHFDPTYIYDLWCGAGVVPEYTRALIQALVRSNELFDNAVVARLKWQNEDPLGDRSVTVTRRVTVPRNGFTGGIDL